MTIKDFLVGFIGLFVSALPAFLFIAAISEGSDIPFILGAVVSSLIGAAGLMFLYR